MQSIHIKQRYTSQQRIWRWHFFAGLFVCPFLILLAATGSIYLFKPQIDHWEEQGINSLAPSSELTNPLLADDLLKIAYQAFPGSKLVRYSLAKENDRSVEIEIKQSSSINQGENPIKANKITLWVDQFSGTILKQKETEKRFLHQVKKLHSELLLGSKASYVIELVASWSIILIVTGLYLWLGRSTIKVADVANKATHTENKKTTTTRWRHLHGSVGFYLAIPFLLLLLTGLPWTQLWGGGFKLLKENMGWAGSGQEWFVTLQSKQQSIESLKKPGHDITLSTITLKNDVNTLTHPIYVMPPKANNGVWTVRSMPQDRSKRVTLHYDQHTGEKIMRIGFEDHHPVEQIISHGVSMHEGALFGLINQLLALLTTLFVIALSIIGIYIWWQRRPKGQLAAPIPAKQAMPYSLLATICLLGILLPTAGISIIMILLIDKCWQVIKPDT